MDVSFGFLSIAKFRWEGCFVSSFRMRVSGRVILEVVLWEDWGVGIFIMLIGCFVFLVEGSSCVMIVET